MAINGDISLYYGMMPGISSVSSLPDAQRRLQLGAGGASKTGQNFAETLANQFQPGTVASMTASALEAQSILALGENEDVEDAMSVNGGPGLETMLGGSRSSLNSALSGLGGNGDMASLDRILSIIGELMGYPPGAFPGISGLNGQNGQNPAYDTMRNGMVPTGQAESLGSLSSRFESGSQGAAAVGYDRVGGTSYGTYQIASKTGTMKEFLNFLDTRAPDLANRLRAAGSADTGSRSGRMPTVWKEIAGENPERFTKLQRDFIQASHYEPAQRMIKERTGIDMQAQNPVLREILWSTAVQHGANGAADIFSSCASRVNSDNPRDFQVGMIQEIYKSRGRRFSSSDDRTRSAVLSRFGQERQLALSMLDAGQVIG